MTFDDYFDRFCRRYQPYKGGAWCYEDGCIYRGLDLLAELPGAKALLEHLEHNPNVKRIAADKDAAMPQFLAWISSKK